MTSKGRLLTLVNVPKSYGTGDDSRAEKMFV